MPGWLVEVKMTPCTQDQELLLERAAYAEMIVRRRRSKRTIRMVNVSIADDVLVIPCSGIGKVHGLMSREATYLVTDELAPRHTDTLCLALAGEGRL